MKRTRCKVPFQETSLPAPENLLKSVPGSAARLFPLPRAEGSGDGGRHGSRSASSPRPLAASGKSPGWEWRARSWFAVPTLCDFAFCQKSSGVFSFAAAPRRLMWLGGNRGEGLRAFPMGALCFVLTESKPEFPEQAPFEPSSSIWEDQSLEQTLSWKISSLLLVRERL